MTKAIATSTVCGAGQGQIGLKTAIPKKIAEKMGLEIGDILIWNSNGSFTVRKAD